MRVATEASSGRRRTVDREDIKRAVRDRTIRPPERLERVLKLDDAAVRSDERFEEFRIA